MAIAHPTPPARFTALTLLAALAAACGGGGSDDPPPAPAADQPPRALIAATASEGFPPLTVTFDAGASSDPDGTITRYRWDFGDSEADATADATGVSVTHTYEEVGTFTVTLEVTDDDGFAADSTHPVRVRGATVSGTVQIAPDSSVDSDVNDRLTVPVSNNTFGSAQAIDIPLRLGGFVNLPGTGPDNGNFHDDGDEQDVFAVDLEGDERLVLSIGDPSADLNLEIYSDEPQPMLIDASVSPDPDNDPTEDLPAPADGGRYFVRVVAVSGASNYVLRINDETQATATPRRAKRLTDPFVPGEVLTAPSRRAAVQLFGIRPALAGTGLRLQSLSRAAPSASAVHMPDVRIPDEATVSPAMKARYRTLLAARHLNVQHDAPVAEVNVLRRPMSQVPPRPDDPLYDEQWHYPAIDLPGAWALTTGDPSVVVAVVDTGVVLNHPDLESNLLRDGAGNVVGYDFIQDPQRANDGDGLDANPSDPGDHERGPQDGSFHGTHVAGTVAASTNNGIGVAGVAGNVRLMPLRVLGVEGGTTFDVLQAVRYAAGLPNVSGTLPPVRADIVNMSLGSDFYSEAEQQTLNEVRSRGVLLVASAGNAGSTIPSYPASYDGVISVAATLRNGNLAPYSNANTHVDVAAPGGGLARNGQFNAVVSTLAEGGDDNIQLGYGGLTGTSMAAPHVTGVIALMKSLYPQLAPGEFDALLRTGALTTDAGPAGRDSGYGWGIIDALDAVVAAQQASGDSLGPIISVSVGTLNFQGFTRQLDFAVNNAGDEPVSITVEEEAPWLTLTALDVDQNGFGQYRAVADRADLADGTYTTTLAVRAENPDLASPVDVSVVMSVTSPDSSADAGQHYVVLVGQESDESVASQVVNARNGQYEFSLEDVPPGDYRLFAGTDLDDDNFICDGGEACGAFPSLSGPEIVRIDPAEQPVRDGVTFASEFRTTATTTVAAEGTGAPPPEGLGTGKPVGTEP